MEKVIVLVNVSLHMYKKLRKLDIIAQHLHYLKQGNHCAEAAHKEFAVSKENVSTVPETLKSKEDKIANLIVATSKLEIESLKCTEALKTPVSILQEILSRRGVTPSYELVQTESITYKPAFRYRVSFDDLGVQFTAIGDGSSKKEAKHSAARALIDQLNGIKSHSGSGGIANDLNTSLRRSTTTGEYIYANNGSDSIISVAAKSEAAGGLTTSNKGCGGIVSIPNLSLRRPEANSDSITANKESGGIAIVPNAYLTRTGSSSSSTSANSGSGSIACVPSFSSTGSKATDNSTSSNKASGAIASVANVSLTKSEVDSYNIVSNPIGCLQEMCTARHWPPPIYETETEAGLPHERVFSIACSVLRFREIGKGNSKKIAKHIAAHKMWILLQEYILDDN